MAQSIGAIQLDLGVNYSQFQNQMGSIAGNAKSIVGAAFGKLGGVIAGAFAVKKLIQFGQESIDLASQLTEVQNVVDTVFGGMAGEINEFAKNAVESFGISELTAKKATSTFGAMYKSMGIGGEQMKEMAKGITALAADMTSFYDVPINDMLVKLRAGIAGEIEPLRQLGINMTIANLEAYAMSQGIRKSYQNMSQAEQAMLRYNYLLSVTSDAQGDFARTSGSWANQVRILGEQWNAFKSTMGEAFIAVLTPVVQGLNVLIGKLNQAAKAFTGFIKMLFGGNREQQKNASTAGAATKAQKSLATGIGNTGKAAKKAAKDMKGALMGFDELNVLQEKMGADAGGIDGGAGGGEIPDYTLPSAEVPEEQETEFTDPFKYYSLTDALTGLSGAWTKLCEAIDYFWNDTGFKEVVRVFAEAAAIAGINLLTGALEVLSGVFNTVGSIIDWFAGLFTGDFDRCINAGYKLVEGLGQIIEDVFVALLGQEAVDAIKTFISEWWTNMCDWWNNKVAPWFTKERWIQLWNDICTWWQNGWQKISNWWNNSAFVVWWKEHVAPWFTAERWGQLWTDVCSWFRNGWQGIVNWWSNSALVVWWRDNVAPWFTSARWSQLWTDVKAWFQSGWSKVSDWWKNSALVTWWNDHVAPWFTSEKWTTLLSGMKDGFMNGFKNAANAAIGVVERMLNFIIGKMNKLSFNVPDWIPGIGGQHWGMNISPVSIPRLARGGIVDQPTLAMVGEAGKEAVVPLENNTGWMNKLSEAVANAMIAAAPFTGAQQGGGDVGDIVFNLDGRTFARIVKPYLDRENKRVGDPVVIITG